MTVPRKLMCEMKSDPAGCSGNERGFFVHSFDGTQVPRVLVACLSYMISNSILMRATVVARRRLRPNFRPVYLRQNLRGARNFRTSEEPCDNEPETRRNPRPVAPLPRRQL